MKKRFIIAPSMLLLIALLFPLISANKIEKTKTTKELKPVKVQASVDFFKNPISDRQKELLVEAVEKYFDKALKQHKIVGAGVSIVKCDSVIYLGGFGKRNASRKETIDEETIFRIGSVSKGFAGVLSGIYVEEGLLSWEDKVHDYVSNFELANKKWTDSVTLSHILSHSSGLPYHSFTNLVEDGIDLNTIAGQFKSIRTIAKPGNIYSYQNAVFALSGAMIEQVSGKSYGEAIAEKIFEPLNMYNASTDHNSLKTASNVAMPHRKYGRRWKSLKLNQKYYNAIPAGGVNASVTDMAKWMRFLLGHNPSVMNSDGLNKVFNPIINLPGKSKYYQKWAGHKESQYAHGWRIHDFKNRKTGESSRMIHHGGHVNSFRSEIAIFPQEDLGITILFNSPTKLARTVVPDIHKIVKEVMDIPVEELLAEVSDF
ncbi:serine hydrolase [Aquimarina sp. MMG015]|uniref:serine hydrolase domain-containing protein n=1 Tax=unclassified Aquimarina TaxID=2627091 RepID=UPI000E54B5AA|nr:MULTISPECIES: serine hydrolase domain-containing protein [unclassified Aquimarina]AXT57721.1 serine hydrolase [Aquimarina sp. AD1]MBQ4805516.1 serine hydrolase [Aquimarina sp. MMG015]RKN02302.1 serine hydrolase [Aquimarina sp. AD1]